MSCPNVAPNVGPLRIERQIRPHHFIGKRHASPAGTSAPVFSTMRGCIAVALGGERPGSLLGQQEPA
jgi:hypothetical protein